MQASNISATWRGNFICQDIEIFITKRPVLLQNESRQILYQIVVKQQRNQPSAEINSYSKRNGSKGTDNSRGVEICRQGKRKTIEKFGLVVYKVESRIEYELRS